MCSDSHTEEVGSWEHVILMLVFCLLISMPQIESELWKANM